MYTSWRGKDNKPKIDPQTASEIKALAENWGLPDPETMLDGVEGVIVARDENGRAVGFQTVTYEHLRRGGEYQAVPVVQHTYVLPDQRRKGLLTRMMLVVVEHFKNSSRPPAEIGFTPIQDSGMEHLADEAQIAMPGEATKVGNYRVFGISALGHFLERKNDRHREGKMPGQRR